MKKIISVILAIAFIVLVIVGCKSYTTASSPFVPTEGLSIEQFLGEYLVDEAEIARRQEVSHQMAECARELGYPEDHEIIKCAQAEWQSAQDERTLNTEAIKNWTDKYETYPYATYIWLYLTKQLGYSDIVAAGILGNIMAETGGGTLNIQYWLYGYDDPNYYGMCQWHKTWYSEVVGTDLIFQCDFLAATIQEAIPSAGCTFEQFLGLRDVRDAAFLFAVGYEKCASSTYAIRQEFAQIAYNYFVD